MTKEALKLALEALQKIYIAPEHEEYIRVWWPACEQAIPAIKEALAQPDQEYKRGYADAMNWKVQNYLEHLPPKEPEQETVAWRDAAIRLGEELSSVGPDGYYNMSARQWLDWSMEQKPRGKNSLLPQRTWVGLSDEEIDDIYQGAGKNDLKHARAIEAKLRSKNEDRN